MRLKLVLIAALVAAAAGAGSCIAIILTAFSSLKPISSPGLLVCLTFLLPAAAVLLASIFVYRHTARRRKLQAFLTAIIATLLSLCLFLLASILSSRRHPTEPPQPAGPHIAS
jgi:purine-cytosine permease-like protein